MKAMCDVAPDDVGGTLNGVPYAKSTPCGSREVKIDCFCPDCTRVLGEAREFRVQGRPSPYPTMAN